MAVLRPIKLVITNWPAGQVEQMTLQNNPENEADGTRQVAFSGELFIERDDFKAEAPPKYYRLTPGAEVRLRGAYFVRCTGFETDADGNVTEVHCTYDPATTGGQAPDGRKVKATIHWVSRRTTPSTPRSACTSGCSAAEVPGEAHRRAVRRPQPRLARRSCTAKVEQALADTRPGEVVQFERLGYFALDPDEPHALPPHRRPQGRVGQRPEAHQVAPSRGT